MDQNNQAETLKVLVLNEIRNNASKQFPIPAKILYGKFDISFRELKRIISDLRIEYPIVAKETEGGGYWLAENENDILDYIQMMDRRKRGYEDTIKIMSNYIQD